MPAPADPLPTPERLYVYNDFPYLRAERPHNREFLTVLDELEGTLALEPHVVLVNVDEQIRKLAARGGYAPFAATLAVGGAGARVARALHARTGWFPTITVLNITREETGWGEYRIRGGTDRLDAELAATGAGPHAVVDDTLYSGLTLRSVLDRLPAKTLRQTTVFLLQAIAETLPRLRRLCAVEVGLEMPGALETEVSVIKASHLFETGAIRRPNGDLAFFERQEWMRAWFPRHVDAIISLCERLHAQTPT
ncbi:MAG: hypothetical protein ACYDCQ_13250 [Dehalococcoidia bacterium]